MPAPAIVATGQIPYETISVVMAPGAIVNVPGTIRYLTLLSATSAADVLLSFNGASFFPFPPALNLSNFEASGIYLRNSSGAPNTVLIAKGMAEMRDNRIAIDVASPMPVSGTVAVSSVGGVSDVEGAAAEAAAPSGNPVRVGGTDGAAMRTLLTDNGGRQVVIGAAVAGAAHTGNPVLVGGSDGTNAQRLRVDTSGRAIVTGAAASGSAVTGNPVLAAGSDGTNARSLTVDTGGRLTISSASSAHDAAVSGNPVRIASRAMSAHFTAVSTGDTVDNLADLNGRQVFCPIGLPQSQDQNRITIATGTETTLIGAVASVRHGMTCLTIANRDTVATTVDIRDTTGGTIRRTIIVPAGQTFCCDMVAAWWQAAVNTNWTIQLRAATTTNAVEISVQSFRVGY